MVRPERSHPDPGFNAWVVTTAQSISPLTPWSRVLYQNLEHLQWPAGDPGPWSYASCQAARSPRHLRSGVGGAEGC